MNPCIPSAGLVFIRSNIMAISLEPTLQEALIYWDLKGVEEILYRKYGATIFSLNEIDKCKKIVNICLYRKIDVNLSESNYSALLHFAVKKLDRETFRSILARSTDFDINALNNYDTISKHKVKPLLHLVIDEGNYNLVQDLLEFGADINVRDECQRTTLFCAVKSVKYELVEMIIKAGCDVNAKDVIGCMAINYIFSERKCKSDTSKKKLPYIEIIHLLCSHGNNLDFNNGGGARMLYNACKLGLFNEVQFLLKFGANMFFVFSKGDTMLHAAAQGHNLKLLKFLLNNGLNIHAKNNNNETPLSKLISYYYHIFNFSSSEFVRRDVDIIEFLVDNGVDVDVNDFILLTLFGARFLFHVPEIMECLLELKAKIIFSFIENFTVIEDEFLSCEKSSPVAENIQEHELFIAFLSMKIDISYFANKTFGEECKLMISIYKKCKLEMNRMKTTKICNNNNVSYSDFLFKDLLKVAKFCRNENVVLALETEFYKKEFPLYKFFIEKRFRRAELLKHCMEVTTRFLNEFFNDSTTDVADVIFSFLKVGDIRNFGRALCAYPEAF